MVLATGVAEKLHSHYPDAELHFMLRKGNESVLSNHLFIKKVWVLNKSKKFRDLIRIIKAIRKQRFDLVINLQRFFTSGIITVLSGAGKTIGFKKNPLSVWFTQAFDHRIVNGNTHHEIERNQVLIAGITDEQAARPRLYPSASDFEKTGGFKIAPYITVSPASVWFTKQWPKTKWIDFLNKVTIDKVYLLGASGDSELCRQIAEEVTNIRPVNLAGKLSPLGSAALMKDAVMNFVNDSAPLHFAGAVNAPVCAVFCSTVPDFGFGPLSDDSVIVETSLPLDCRPCGLHGHRQCPRGHFHCADIPVNALLGAIPS